MFLQLPSDEEGGSLCNWLPLAACEDKAILKTAETNIDAERPTQV